MSPEDSIPSLRVWSCICSNLMDGDMAARVAAVRWIADWTTSAPMMTFSTRAWWSAGSSEAALPVAEWFWSICR